MRSSIPTLALGLAGILLAAGGCSDPVTPRGATTATEPVHVMALHVLNATAEPIDVLLDVSGAVQALGSIPAGRQLGYLVDVRALGGGGVGRLLATRGDTWVLRSDPFWVDVDRALDFTVTAGGIVWKPTREESH